MCCAGVTTSPLSSSVGNPVINFKSRICLTPFVFEFEIENKTSTSSSSSCSFVLLLLNC